jgi:hypothetical protein
MTVATDYFARVRPLLGEGLSRKVVAFEGEPAVAALVIELLASCMLEHVTGGDAFVAQHTWKRPFAPLRTSPAPAHARIVARRGPPSIAWSHDTVVMSADPDDVLAYVDVSYHVARTLRDVLLRAPASPTPRQPFDPRGIACDARGKHVMVIGCGSLGSEAVRMLSPARFTLVDDAAVTVYNLARQWFGAADVGRAKVDALQDRLDVARTWRTRLEADHLPAFEALVREDPPDVVLLATGTHHHAMLAERLWHLGIPHVAACCYPRARYFEVSVIAPREHTPCLHCFRGHLYRGPAEPLPDDVAAFLYEPAADDVRAQRYTDLVAEPASQIETLRAAHVLARCAAELMSPVRSPWFSRVLADSTTCLLGGNVAGAYGITHAGQVLRLGLDDIAGPTDQIRCDVCARTMQVALREDLPALDDAADAAFL